MKLNKHGWFSGMRRVVSPNYDARPARQKVNLLIIHSISLPPERFGGSAVEQLFTNQLDCDAHQYYDKLRGVKVSAHFFIRRNGAITQFVSCFQRAWHAGASLWKGRSRCNDFSIGIELEGSDAVSYTDAQYASLAYLTRRLKRSFKIRDITGHSNVAPERKTDPGPFFDWQRYLKNLSSI